MYPYSVSGYDPNNSRFSPCSHRLISRVLDIIAEGKRRQCFISTVPSYCGNRVREPGEECDCGFSADICSDRCCYPRLLTDADRDANRSAAGCARRADTQCRSETDCQLRSTCNGSSSTCPPPAHKPNMTECQKGSKVCIAGLCQASVCVKTGLIDCALTSNDTQVSGVEAFPCWGA
ncbi:disintegrin and metalloproteinase domain-containing protein 10-like [Pollicipes pollicipes]|uniref:disintegrin and metalloproteinase domain-containing protein 10-like n=1 Tax=Pollicipes pollicipes TaxID=41117 RepID=UPI001884BEF5|nr:disintegrin and metalloproteinase domain-containing protein 10-like [Pollicipes pollicipes]